jgi:hypothetical protein
MGKDSNVVHQYFKKDFGDHSILVKVNPLTFFGAEITLHLNDKPQFRDMEFDADIFEDLKTDGFEEASPIEFNLYLSGLI